MSFNFLGGASWNLVTLEWMLIESGLSGSFLYTDGYRGKA